MKTNCRFEKIKAEVKIIPGTLEIILFIKVVNEQIVTREIQTRELKVFFCYDSISSLDFKFETLLSGHYITNKHFTSEN